MKYKYNNNLLDLLKLLKQAKDILEAHVGKYIMGHYVEILEEFKNMTGAYYKKKIKSEEFNKYMAYILTSNSDQSKYFSLENGLASQYSMKNNQ